MNVNQLMIGNFLDSDGSILTIKKHHFETIEKSCARPLTLGENWLLMFGFEKHKDEGVKSYHIIINGVTFSYSLHEIAMNRLSIKTDRETSDWIHIDNVIHVHRLQNIVFSITETELNRVK